MKRLLTYLFLVIGLGLIFSESTFAKEKAYFCSKKTSYMTTYTLTPLPCNKIVVAGSTKWKKISAKKYITYIINTYGREDAVIQSLYDEFEKHDLDTNIIREITKKEKKKKKTLVAKKIDKKQEGIEGKKIAEEKRKADASFKSALDIDKKKKLDFFHMLEHILWVLLF